MYKCTRWEDSWTIACNFIKNVLRRRCFIEIFVVFSGQLFLVNPFSRAIFAMNELNQPLHSKYIHYPWTHCLN